MKKHTLNGREQIPYDKIIKRKVLGRAEWIYGPVKTFEGNEVFVWLGPMKKDCPKPTRLIPEYLVSYEYTAKQSIEGILN